MKAALAAFGAGGGAALSGCGDTGELDSLPGGREGRVTGVISGDLIELDGRERVRLSGVEAPHGGQPYADASGDALAALADRRRVELMFGGARSDAFGRTLAQVRDADSRRWVQGRLLAAGAARVRTWADNRALAAPMLAIEAHARKEKRGLWTMDAYRVRLPSEVSGADDGFMLVEGRVARVGEGGAGVYLDFARDWRNALSVSVARAALRDFRRLATDPYDLEGRLVRVRGLVRDLRLSVDHPEQIERLAG